MVNDSALAKVGHVFTFRGGLLSMLQTTEGAQSDNDDKHTRSNIDLDPTPYSARTWGTWYVMYSIADVLAHVTQVISNVRVLDLIFTHHVQCWRKLD